MATSVDDRGRAASGKQAERRFFSSYMIAIALIIFVGFAPSFFLRGMVEPFFPLRPWRTIHLVHGLLATVFALLFPLQAWLIAGGKRAMHVEVGKWGFMLGVAMIPAGYVIAASGYHNMPPESPVPAAVPVALTFFLLPALALVLWLGWKHRFDAQAHKRFMVVAACLLAGPAVNRMPFWENSLEGPLVMIASWLVVLLLPLWAWDFAGRRKPHWATVVGTATSLVQALLSVAVMPIAAWQTFVLYLPGFGVP